MIEILSHRAFLEQQLGDFVHQACAKRSRSVDDAHHEASRHGDGRLGFNLNAADFQPRALTEAAVIRFYKQHNATKLDDPEFIKGVVMKMSDDEIRSECMRRYRAAPEPAGNRMSM